MADIKYNLDWKGINPYVNKSNVDRQDAITLEDLNSLDELDLTTEQGWQAIGNQVLQAGLATGAGKFINSAIEEAAGGIDAISGLFGGDTTHQEGWKRDVSGTANPSPGENPKQTYSSIEKIKNSIQARKMIKISAKNGTYNTVTNMLGIAGIICAGSLGAGDGYSWKTGGGISGAIDNVLGSLTGSTLELGSSARKWYEKLFDAMMFPLGDRATRSHDDAWILDPDEIAALNAAAFNTIMGNKPGLKTGLNGYTRRYQKVHERLDTWRDKIKERNSFTRGIGRLYIEPFYNNEDFVNFSIPFEFNPNISEGGVEAKYNETQLMNKVLPIRSYISTSGSTLQIETSYMALAPDGANVVNTSNISPTDIWMLDWTNEQIEKIELQLRSLVMPNVANGSFVRPPIVQVRMEATENEISKIFDINKQGVGKDKYSSVNDDLGDLYKYPKEMKGDYLNYTKIIDGDTTRYKRYIVTSVQISPLESYGVSYLIPSQNIKPVIYEGFTKDFENNKFKKERDGFNYYSYRRNGFKVSLTLSETTKNFLDIVPDYRTYYDSWKAKQTIQNSEQTNTLEELDKYSELNIDDLDARLNSQVSNFWNKHKLFCNKHIDSYKDYHKQEQIYKAEQELKDSQEQFKNYRSIVKENGKALNEWNYFFTNTNFTEELEKQFKKPTDKEEEWKKWYDSNKEDIVYGLSGNPKQAYLDWCKVKIDNRTRTLYEIDSKTLDSENKKYYNNIIKKLDNLEAKYKSSEKKLEKEVSNVKSKMIKDIEKSSQYYVADMKAYSEIRETYDYNRLFFMENRAMISVERFVWGSAPKNYNEKYKDAAKEIVNPLFNVNGKWDTAMGNTKTGEASSEFESWYEAIKDGE